MKDLITYVIHYTPLKERKYFQLEQLDKLALKIMSLLKNMIKKI